MTAVVQHRSAYTFPVTSDEYPAGYLSPTQINEYRDCPRCYYHARVERIPRPESIHFAIGGALHKAAEAIGQSVLEGHGMADFDEIAAQQFDEQTTVPVDPETGVEFIELELASYDSIGEAKDATMRFLQPLKKHLPKLYRDRGLIAVEHDLMDFYDPMDPLWPFPLKGRIDALYGDPQTGIVSMITDLKTSSRTGGPDQNGALQLGIYGMGGDIKLGCDTLIKRKESPELISYWANGTGMVTPEQQAVIRDIVIDVANRISAGDFPIGKGWNGRHNYEHGTPEFTMAVSWPDVG